MNRNIIVIVELEGEIIPVPFSHEEYVAVQKVASELGCSPAEFAWRAVLNELATANMIEFPRD